MSRAVADKWFSLLVRDNAGWRCEKCGKAGVRASGSVQLQCAHNFSRRYSATRVDFDNAACLCAACHRYLTENPHEHVEWFREYLGPEHYETMRRRAYDGRGLRIPTGYWKEKAAELREMGKARGLSV